MHKEVIASKTNPPHYRADIDGLRALAIILVVTFHAFPTALPSGFIGVDIFFVISGYLITGIMLRDFNKQKFSFIEFYGRRFRRIAPALLTVLLGSWILGRYFLSGIDFKILGKHIIAGATYTSNFCLLKESGYFDTISGHKPLLHLWSLAIEEQFYLLWPIFLFIAYRFLWKVPLIICTIGIFSFTYNLIRISTAPSSTFYMLPTRFWELIIGAGLAYIVLNSKPRTQLAQLKSLLGCVLILSSLLLINQTTPFPGLVALLPTLGAFMIIWAGPQSWINKNILSNKLAVSIGLFSYPLYLWHWPLLSISRMAFDSEPSVQIRLGLITLSAFLAFVTWRGIEVPFQKLFSNRIANSISGSLAIIGLAISSSILICILGYFTKMGRLYTTPQKQDISFDNIQFDTDNDGDHARAGKCFLDTSLPFSKYDPICYTAVPPLKPYNMLLIGDSHGAHLFPGIANIASDLNVNLFQLNASSCPPVSSHSELFGTNCALSNNFTFNWIKNNKPDVIILFAKWDRYLHNPKFLPLFDQTLIDLKNYQIKHIFVVGPSPRWLPSLRKVIERNFIKLGAPPPERSLVGLDTYIFKANNIMQNRSAHFNVHFISISNHVCNSNGCLTLIHQNKGPTSLYTFDDAHLTSAAANSVTKSFIGPQIKQIMSAK